jgi:hypothetical protein
MSTVHQSSGVPRPFRGILSDLIPYALETDWPVGAGGFEPLHSRIGIGQDSQPRRRSSNLRTRESDPLHSLSHKRGFDVVRWSPANAVTTHQPASSLWKVSRFNDRVGNSYEPRASSIGSAKLAIPYALDSDWPVEAEGFEPLHFGIRSAAVDHGLKLSSGMRSGTTNFN